MPPAHNSCHWLLPHCLFITACMAYLYPKDSPTPRLAAKRSNFLQIQSIFNSFLIQIHFRFTSDSLQI
ncbi:hypothetical protein ACN38_g3946 [Penicillium nordicum]|uniref:Uncharacterized protein n=1 Tax=Penicillium nordicum TaxID=229535 RepID=A0A0M8PBB3_9EURO|nr:hypothetical protein ACN38_g3946 [Penicillium nordicum]